MIEARVLRNNNIQLELLEDIRHELREMRNSFGKRTSEIGDLMTTSLAKIQEDIEDNAVVLRDVTEQGLKNLKTDIEILKFNNHGSTRLVELALTIVGQVKAASLDPVAARNVAARIRMPTPLPDNVPVDPSAFNMQREEAQADAASRPPSVLSKPTDIVTPAEMDQIFTELAAKAMGFDSNLEEVGK